MKNTRYITALFALLPATGWAHSGHAHAPAETLGGMLHTLMTHPGLFGIIGLLLIAAMLYRNQ